MPEHQSRHPEIDLIDRAEDGGTTDHSDSAGGHVVRRVELDHLEDSDSEVARVRKSDEDKREPRRKLNPTVASSTVPSPQDLAELEACLDRMIAPATLTVRGSDIERIFPAEDGTLVRLERFAIDHSCVPIHSFGGIVFEKVHP